MLRVLVFSLNSIGTVIGIFKSEAKLWPEFADAIAARPSCVIDDLDMSVIHNVAQLPRILKLTARFRDVPKRHQLVVNRLLKMGVTTLLSTDRPISLLNSLAISCPDVRQVLVAHTTIQPLNRPRISETLPFPNRTLLVWGLRDKEIVGALQPHLKIHVNGSLRNATFLRHQAMQSRVATAEKICVISSHLGEAKEESRRDKPSDIRYLLRERLLELASTASLQLGLPLHIALKPPTMGFFSEGTEAKHDAEREYFRRAFRGLSISFSDPSMPYSSYQASNESLLTVGLPTGALVETLGRGSAAMTLDTNGAPEFAALPAKYIVGRMEAASIASRFGQILETSTNQRSLDLQDWIFDAMSDGPLSRLGEILSA